MREFFRRAGFRGGLAGLITLGTLALPGQALDLVPIPPLTGRVVDEAGVLSAADKADVESYLADVEARKGAQIAVLILPTTKPEAIEQYSLRVAEAWKLGRKKVDDGFLFLVATDDHAARFEVGYGLEGALSDAVSHRILDEIAIPHFRDGDYPGGVRAGLEAAVKVVDGEALPPPPAPGGNGGKRGPPFQLLLVGAFFAVLFLRTLFGRVFGGVLGGALVAVAAWLLLGSLVLGIVLGAVALVLALVGFIPLGGMGGGFGGMGGGGFGGGSFGGGGGGGFGGGGGSFGGGGASGNW